MSTNTESGRTCGECDKKDSGCNRIQHMYSACWTPKQPAPVKCPSCTGPMKPETSAEFLAKRNCSVCGVPIAECGVDRSSATSVCSYWQPEPVKEDSDYYKSLLIIYGWEPSKEGAATWMIKTMEKLHDAEHRKQPAAQDVMAVLEDEELVKSVATKQAWYSDTHVEQAERIISAYRDAVRERSEGLSK